MRKAKCSTTHPGWIRIWAPYYRVKLRRAISTLSSDNNGKVIFVELSSEHSHWKDMAHGQRLLYENCIRGTVHCAVLCKHSVPAGRQIDTRNDVERFEPMLYVRGRIIVCRMSEYGGNNDGWDMFVTAWFDNPLRVRNDLLAKQLIRE